MSTTITPMRPHLFKAYYNWCMENAGNTYIIVLSHFPGVNLPPHVKKSEFTRLCIRPEALVNYNEDEYGVSFSTRFNGIHTPVYIPYGAIQAISDTVMQIDVHFPPEEVYWNEFKRGQMNILNQIDEIDSSIEHDAPATRPSRGKPNLTLVK